MLATMSTNTTSKAVLEASRRTLSFTRRDQEQSYEESSDYETKLPPRQKLRRSHLNPRQEGVTNLWQVQRMFPLQSWKGASWMVTMTTKS